MAKLLGDSATAERGEPGRARSLLSGHKRALEVVALRGKDVVGVRHLLDGGRATLGTGSDAIARIGPCDASALPVTIADVEGLVFRVHVPARSRARLHGADGIARLLTGPRTLYLADGERAVVYVGPLRIRVQIATVETVAKVLQESTRAVRWIAVVGALYVAALAFCASLVPERPAHLNERGLQHVVQAIELRLP